MSIQKDPNGRIYEQVTPSILKRKTAKLDISKIRFSEPYQDKHGKWFAIVDTPIPKHRYSGEISNQLAMMPYLHCLFKIKKKKIEWIGPPSTSNIKELFSLFESICRRKFFVETININKILTLCDIPDEKKSSSLTLILSIPDDGIYSDSFFKARIYAWLKQFNRKNGKKLKTKIDKKNKTIIFEIFNLTEETKIDIKKKFEKYTTTKTKEKTPIHLQKPQKRKAKLKIEFSEVQQDEEERHYVTLKRFYETTVSSIRKKISHSDGKFQSFKIYKGEEGEPIIRWEGDISKTLEEIKKEFKLLEQYLTHRQKSIQDSIDPKIASQFYWEKDELVYYPTREDSDSLEEVIEVISKEPRFSSLKRYMIFKFYADHIRIAFKKNSRNKGVKALGSIGFMALLPTESMSEQAEDTMLIESEHNRPQTQYNFIIFHPKKTQQTPPLSSSTEGTLMLADSISEEDGIEINSFSRILEQLAEVNPSLLEEDPIHLSDPAPLLFSEDDGLQDAFQTSADDARVTVNQSESVLFFTDFPDSPLDDHHLSAIWENIDHSKDSHKEDDSLERYLF